MKIALFKNMEHGFTSVCEDHMENCDTYVRVSEYMDVEFPPLTDGEVVNKQIAVLEKAKKAVQAKAELKLAELDHQIGELLALPQSV